MISKQEFKEIVKQEKAFLEDKGLLTKKDTKTLAKIRKKTAFCYRSMLYAIACFFICSFILLFLEPGLFFHEDAKENHPIIYTIMIICSLVAYISYLLGNNESYMNNKAKLLQKNYEKILSSLGVQKNTDKRFKKFDSLPGIRKPHICPAYKVGNFIIQNFANRGTGGHRTYKHGYDSEVLFFYEKNDLIRKRHSFYFRKLSYFEKTSSIYRIGMALKKRFDRNGDAYFGDKKGKELQILSGIEYRGGYTYFGYQKGKERQILLKYKAVNFSPVTFTNRSAAFDVFLSSHQEESINNIYDEIAFLTELSKQI